MRKRQIAKVGDVFWVPLEDESVVLGQVVEIQPEALNSITCAFFDCRRELTKKAEPDFSNAISVQFVTKDLFASGHWQRQANMPVQIPTNIFPYRETEPDGWIGAKIIGSGIIRMFLSAFYGLRDWTEMHDPGYYQNLLLAGVSKRGAA